jgi:hypothetical protein
MDCYLKGGYTTHEICEKIESYFRTVVDVGQVKWLIYKSKLENPRNYQRGLLSKSPLPENTKLEQEQRNKRQNIWRSKRKIELA